MYTAQGKDPHPVILLLHGFPGHERNFDLAQIFRRAGYHVVVFHYRGAWGSEGNFAFSHVLQDAEEAIKYLRQPESIARYNIDPENITAIGHSMGGWAALHLAGNGFVARVASIAGANIGVWGELAADSPQAKAYSMAFFEESLSPLHGTSAEALIDEVIRNMDDFDTMQHINKLSTLDVLLVAGEQDDGVPASLHHMPLVTLLEKRNAAQLTHTILDADHGFNDKRLTLAQVILDWLQS
jgi:pimeloyl-ACP methyl ester carboxylesterase